VDLKVAVACFAGVNMTMHKTTVDMACFFSVFFFLNFPISIYESADCLSTLIFTALINEFLGIWKPELNPLINEQTEHGKAPEIKKRLAHPINEKTDC